MRRKSRVFPLADPDEAGAGQPDPLILPFLEASEAEAQEMLGRLITLHARPVIRKVLRGRPGLQGAEAGDLESEIVLLLIERLHRARLRDEGIRDLKGYVAVVTYNALTAHGKKQGPERPWGREGEAEGLFDRLADPAPDAATALERRSHLERLWGEIRQLSPQQAAALILNLRDGEGRGAVALLPLTGVATMRDIARTLEMPAERFAEIWNRLPLEDSAIAESLGVSRQQVINLRKSARERLARRMRKY